MNVGREESMLCARLWVDGSAVGRRDAPAREEGGARTKRRDAAVVVVVVAAAVVVCECGEDARTVRLGGMTVGSGEMRRRLSPARS